MTRYLLDVNVLIALIDPAHVSARYCARLVCFYRKPILGDVSID